LWCNPFCLFLILNNEYDHIQTLSAALRRGIVVRWYNTLLELPVKVKQKHHCQGHRVVSSEQTQVKNSRAGCRDTVLFGIEIAIDIAVF
jgi:hypothetical protein